MRNSQRQKVITCILPKGRASPLAKHLACEHGLTTVDVHYARGVGRITPLRHRGIGETSEREILTVAVPADEADTLFAHIYEVAEINRPHGGLMFMHASLCSTTFELPDLPEED
ncbi:hypothetical protein ThidrDRAFT_3918 [Thiorhodococcus drewsii AZ1]|uniref:Nitrogen regulatory protein P-II n=1 Tax=Thiorhodococcus drewsii AZ1 TaxID=765913 RepID=G2E6K5_9GAMM|nr:hypothetical protein [Thiorhodococcus drewsii]EGV28289.1 hypothetical protein ThidrDRAFT_3918 [Thiorhodococcus drewsii AZ1]